MENTLSGEQQAYSTSKEEEEEDEEEAAGIDIDTAPRSHFPSAAIVDFLLFFSSVWSVCALGVRILES